MRVINLESDPYLARRHRNDRGEDGGGVPRWRANIWSGRNEGGSRLRIRHVGRMLEFFHGFSYSHPRVGYKKGSEDEYTYPREDDWDKGAVWCCGLAFFFLSKSGKIRSTKK
jgi:hypothetical protein